MFYITQSLFARSARRSAPTHPIFGSLRSVSCTAHMLWQRWRIGLCNTTRITQVTNVERIRWQTECICDFDGSRQFRRRQRSWRSSRSVMPRKDKSICHLGYRNSISTVLISVSISTVVNRKNTPNVFDISSRKRHRFWQNLVRVILSKFVVQKCKRFPPHLNNISTLPCET